MAKKKKRLPIEQLREAGLVARQMLKDRGIISKESFIDDLMSKRTSPLLPGVPGYLPHRWTIIATQKMMTAFIFQWIQKTSANRKGNDLKRENVTEFFIFVVKELKSIERKFKKEVKEQPEFIKNMKTVPVLADIFGPLRKRDTIKAMERFFVDSFAIAIVLKQNHSTSDYCNWFLDWTLELDKIWGEKEKVTPIT